MPQCAQRLCRPAAVTAGQNATFATDDTQKAADGGRLMGAHGDDDDSRR